MNVLDTNIWIYLHDHRDKEKQAIAQRLVATTQPLALPWQVGCEFLAACRKLQPFGFDRETAWNAFDEMQQAANEILLPVPQLWVKARELQSRYPVSFWDGLLIAACLHGQVTILYSEDFEGLGPIDGLTIVNPFV
jgi:predicted nucleic acid-binding protein